MKKILYPVVLLIAFLSVISFAQAQNSFTVSGKIQDTETDETIAGVNIVVKGTVQGTISDVDGKFNLTTKIHLPATLVISFLGYKTQEISVTETDQSFNIQLVPGA